MRRLAKASSAASTHGTGSAIAASPSALLWALALATVALLAFATSAQASTTRVHQSSFGSFTKPEAIAVDQGSGDLYVIDAGAGTISRFKANGDPDPFSASAAYISANELTGTASGALGLGAESENQIAIAPPGSPAGTAGDIYVAAVGAGIDVFAPSGEYLGRIDNIEGTDAAPFGYVCGVATDPAGNLYVGDYSNGIYKYVPTANPPTNADFDSQLSGFSGHCNIAAGATKVYASAWAGGSLTSYPSSLFPGDQKAEDASAAGTTIEDENGPVTSKTASVDPSNDHVLVDEGNQVAEFDSAGNFVARFGAGDLSGSWGVAVKGGGNAYVADGDGTEVDVFGPLVLLPDVTTDTPVEVHPTTATLAGHIDPGGPAASCELQFTDDEDFQANGYDNADTAACVPAGPFTVAQDVTSTPSSLQAGTVYHYRFASTNANGTVQGNSRTFTTPIVELATGAASNLTQHSATLNGTVNPGGLAVSDCHFEWGTDSTYGHSLACVPNPGSGTSPVAVHADLAGLDPATPYFFRLVATTANGTADGRLGAFATQGLVPQSTNCPNEARRLEQHSTALPDCRAYEMVSPVDKNGGDIEADTTRTRAAADGNAIQFSSLIGFGDSGSVTVDNDFMALRGADGWVRHGITPEQEPLTNNDLVNAGLAPRYEGEFSPDLDRGVFLAGSPLNAEDPNVERAVNLYRRDDLRSSGAGSYKLLSPCPACSGPLSIDSAQQPRLAGTSADFSKVIFESKRNLVVGAEGQLPKLYEWADGSLRLAGILPNGSIASSSGAGQGATVFIYTHSAISQDGSKVFFAAPLSAPKGEVEDEADLYMRDDRSTPTTADDTTRQLNLSERADPDPNTTQAARFWDATPDGGYVFFTSNEALTDDASINAAPKLYRYDTQLPAGDPANLTLIAEIGGGEGRFGVAGISDDGSYVYFDGQSTSSASGLAMFVWHDGTVRQIGGVEVNDTLYLSLRQWKQPMKVRVTPDGTHMVFVTEGTGDPSDLTGYDQGSECPLGAKPSCTEVYLYDATANGGAGELSCVSCNPAGTPPVPGADADFAYHFPIGQNNTSSHINRALSSDGRYVFFSTAERLLDSDTNGVSDAYQYDTVSGELSLLSSGTNSSPSYFIEASPDGRNAFFVTREPLLGRDPDTAFDLYDARVNGGFAEPVVQAPCSGDACRGAVSAAPGAVTPGSASLVGPGNPKPPKPPRCRKHKGKHRPKHCTKKHSQRSATRANRNHGGEK